MMARVYEVARELGMSSRELMDLLADLGHPVTSHSSNVDASVAAELRSNETHASSSPRSGDTTGTLERAEPESAPELKTPEPPAGPPEPSTGEAETLEAPAEPPAEEREREGGEARRSRLGVVVKYLAELPMLVAFALLIAVLVKTFLIQAFFIPSGSMQPTLAIGDRVLVEKLGYRISDPGRGHVVVFERQGFGGPQDLGAFDRARIFLRELLGLPTGAREDFIKRVVAVGGDSIRYGGEPRVLAVNGEPVDEPYLDGADRHSPAINRRNCERLEMQQTEEGCRVPAGMVFVMGDNRNNSEDSRVFGPVEQDEIVGRAVLLIWPAPHFGTL